MKGKRKVLLISLFLSLFLAFVAEVFVGNLNSMLHGEKSLFYDLNKTDSAVSIKQEEALVPLTKEEQNSILVDRENARILAEVNGETYIQKKEESLIEDGNQMFRKSILSVFSVKLPVDTYIGKVHFRHPDLEQKSAYELEITKDGQTVFQGIDGIADERIPTSVIQAGASGDAIILRFYANAEPDLSKMELGIVNAFQLNPLRILFLFVTFLAVALFLFGKDCFVTKQEHVFAGIALTLGTILIMAVGTNQIGFDEHIHAARSYNLSFKATVETTETAMRMKANDLPMFHNVEERALVEAYEEENHDFSWADITTQSRFVTYTDRSYLPAAIFMRLGRMMNLSFAGLMMLGKFGILLCYTAVVFLAIRLAKSGKGLLAVLALLPNNLFAAVSLSYDSIVTGFLFLAVVLTVNALLEKGKKLTWLQTLLLLGAYIAGSTAKPVYMVMALLILFFPHSKFENKVQEVFFKLMVVGLVGLMTYTIFFPPVSASSSYEMIGNLAYAGDKRNQGTSVLGQLQYILSAPLAYSRLLLSSMSGSLWNYVSGQLPFYNYGYLGNLSGIWNIISVLLIGGAALWAPQGEERKAIGTPYKWLTLLMIFGVSAIIWTSMYVSFTPVANPVIEGVQARYFIPLFLPGIYCLFSKKRFCKLSAGVYYKILFGLVTILNLWAIYSLALKPMNF